MPAALTPFDRVGLLRPAVDAHTLGLTALAQLLEDCGHRAVLADAALAGHLNDPDTPDARDALAAWIRAHGVTVLGFSYRLDPQDGLRLAARLVHALKQRRLFAPLGGPIRALYFAGLPAACEQVQRQVPEVAGVFQGDETPAETLARLGVDPGRIPRELAEGVRYDDDRLAFGRDLVRREAHLSVGPVSRAGYPEFGTARDTLAARLAHGRAHGLPPLLRVHAGPYDPDPDAGVRRFLDWTRQLAAGGLLDVLSIGTSQLTQSHFGQSWDGLPNGGGVPIRTPEQYAAVWEAARPMLVRTYAGTRNLADLARLHEERLHIAWHALSLWWFCRLDGRGPYSLRENLAAQFEALQTIAASGKPYEPNVAHHFAFRGADDVTALAATVLAARTAKRLGIRRLVLQVMLNTPRSTWGIQDLAKARALLALVRPLEDDRFQVILQPRGGLDFFSPDPQKAKAQLAAVTALMDDIEPRDTRSPPLIHVVSYSEGYALADPPVIAESLQIVRAALDAYRDLRRRGMIDDMTDHPETVSRTARLQNETLARLAAMEAAIPDLLSEAGLYQAFAQGFLHTPYLWEGRDELAPAVRARTRLSHGGVILEPEPPRTPS